MKEMLASEESTEEGEAGFGKEDMRDRLGQVVSR